MTRREAELTDLIEEGEHWFWVRGAKSADEARRLAGAQPDRECNFIGIAPFIGAIWGVAKPEKEGRDAA